MPMCEPPSNTMRSPGRASSIDATAVPSRICSRAVRGMSTPRSANARCTRPEQSMPAAVSPPHTYGTPRYLLAESTSAAPLAPDVGDAVTLAARPAAASACANSADDVAPVPDAPVALEDAAAGAAAGSADEPSTPDAV